MEIKTRCRQSMTTIGQIMVRLSQNSAVPAVGAVRYPYSANAIKEPSATINRYIRLIILSGFLLNA